MGKNIDISARVSSSEEVFIVYSQLQSVGDLSSQSYKSHNPN